MKKVLFFIFFACIPSSTITAQYVTISNIYFRNALTQLYPNCMSGNYMDTTCLEILNEDSLDISYPYGSFGYSISDITGIQYFKNLKYLNCNSNSLTSLSTLPDSLVTLLCGGNELTSLPNLHSKLKYLNCGTNLITYLPQLPDSLKEFDCSFNQLMSLPLLPDNLEHLNCRNNFLSSLPLLPSSLTLLYCDFNQLTMLPALPSSLNFLYCKNNQLDSLPTLPFNLAVLECSYNQLTSLPNLTLNWIPTLKCDHNQLTTLPSLYGPIWGGEIIDCSYNQLTSLPQLPWNLDDLICNNNQLTSLPPLTSDLYSLYCGNNQLTSLPTIPNSLISLRCDTNQLTSLPLLPNTMYEFKINNNNILCLTNLPQVNNTANVAISDNPFTCVPNQTNYSFALPLCMDNDPVNNPSNCQADPLIIGKVYKDLDTNCLYNGTDLNIDNIPVKLHDTQNNFLALGYTSNGIYNFSVPLLPDTYLVKINVNDLPVSMDCGLTNTLSITLDSTSQTIDNINFPVICDTIYDIKIQSVNTQGLVFPGQTHTFNTNITNFQNWLTMNCPPLNYSGIINVSVTGPVTYISPANGALIPQINGNNFTYNISNFSNLTANSFGLNFYTDTTAQAGNQICVQINISSLPLDADTTNNQYDFCYQVVNSYDPNMKEVYPINVLPGYDDWFTYTIHFQNTGNAPAINIKLRDTLDSQLDLNTFEVLGYSHSAITTLSGNKLTVRFNNIMLPDSTTDYEGSMGYFQYRIKPFPNLPIGSQIENTAYIYFDYNAPIITNTTQNNFDILTNVIHNSVSKKEFKLYPNPSNGIFSFTDYSNLKTVEVYTLLGEKIVSQTTQKQINLSNFPKGIYFARINGEQVIKLVKE